MKAFVIKEYGDNSVVQYTDIDHPEPQVGELLLVKIHAGASIPWTGRSAAVLVSA